VVSASSTGSGEPTQRSLDVVGKIVFGLGDHSVNLALTALSLVFLFFLTDIAGLEPLLAGAVVWTARIVDAVTDPLMGRLSDRTKMAGGRRRPYFLIGALPLGASFALVWQTPFSGQLAMFGYYTVVYIGVSLSLTTLTVPYMALIPEMAIGYDERTSLNTFRNVLTIAAAMLAASMFALADSLGGDAAAYTRVGLIFAVWLVVPWPFVYRVSFERAQFADAPQSSFREALRDLVAHRNFLRLCALFVASRTAIDLASASLPFFFGHWLRRPEDTTFALLSLLGTVVLVLPLWMLVARRVEKHKLLIVGCVWWMICSALMFLADPSWPRWVLLVFPAVIGVGFALVDLMPWSMLGEAIDEGELQSGARRDGLYSGFFTFLRKAAGATAILVAGGLLQLAGYGSQTPPPESALLAIRAMTSLAPVFFLGLTIALAVGYPLTRSLHSEIRTQLDRGRGAR
jgi:sugar (glycoside-pentoside-hexuronide) transporter